MVAARQIRVVRLAHVVYQHPDLEKALAFLFDFGFVEEQRTPERVYLRGYGSQPFIYVAEQSVDSKRHFIGAYWVVDTLEDLQAAADHPSATPIQDSDAPGGGKVVTLDDPNGYKIGFVFGQTLNERREPKSTHETTEPISNAAQEKPRKGRYRRFKTGASPVHKLGHYGFMVPPSKFESTLSWYLDLLNLKPTDAVFNPETGKDETCFCHVCRPDPVPAD
jgi:catechol 2,3-dioxygenase-like lactoylglutathione lyase family enzyme